MSREKIKNIVCQAVAGTKDLTQAIDDITELTKVNPQVLADFLVHTNKSGTIGKGSYLDQAKTFLATNPSPSN